MRHFLGVLRKTLKYLKQCVNGNPNEPFSFGEEYRERLNAPTHSFNLKSSDAQKILYVHRVKRRNAWQKVKGQEDICSFIQQNCF